MEALLRSVCGATMTTTGGACTRYRYSFLRARRTGFSHRVGAFSLFGSGLYNACIVGRVVLGYWVVLHQRGLRSGPLLCRRGCLMYKRTTSPNSVHKKHNT